MSQGWRGSPCCSVIWHPPVSKKAFALPMIENQPFIFQTGRPSLLRQATRSTHELPCIELAGMQELSRDNIRLALRVFQSYKSRLTAKGPTRYDDSHNSRYDGRFSSIYPGLLCWPANRGHAHLPRSDLYKVWIRCRRKRSCGMCSRQGHAAIRYADLPRLLGFYSSTTRSVRLSRPPFGSSVDEPALIRSTP